MTNNTIKRLCVGVLLLSMLACLCQIFLQDYLHPAFALLGLAWIPAGAFWLLADMDEALRER